MSTLQHIPNHALPSRLGHRLTVALVVLALAVGALVAALAINGGDASPVPDKATAVEQSIAQTDPKYWVTHHRPAAATEQPAQLGSKAQTDPKYFVTHQLP